MDVIVQSLRQSFKTKVTHGIKWRIEQLNALMRLVDENQDELIEAIKKDLKRHEQETVLAEFSLIKNGIIYSLNHLEKWMKPTKADLPVLARAAFSAQVYNEPLGVVLIIGAWNYPYQLTLETILNKF